MGFGGFSWKRATGLTKAKTKISRAIGIPLTKGGRQRKFGAALGGNILGAVPSLSQSPRSRKAKKGKLAHDESSEMATSLNLAPYGLCRKSSPSYLLPIGLTIIAIAAFPSGTLVALVVGFICYNGAKKRKEKENAAIARVAAEVAGFGFHMSGIELPDIKPLTRGAPEKIFVYEEERENHLRIATVLANHGFEPARKFAECLAACGTMKELDDPGRQRTKMLLDMANQAGHPEVSYFLKGVYGDNEDVRNVLDRAHQIIAFWHASKANQDNVPVSVENESASFAQ